MIEILIGIVVFTLIVMALGLFVIGARSIVMPSHDVAVVINGAQPLAARTGQKLLNALNDNGVNIPSACGGAGTCGLCRVAVTDGGGDVLPTEAARLSKRDIKEGVRLACQVAIRSDMEIEVSPDLLNVEPISCKVVSARNLSPLIREIVFELPEDSQIEPRAGAYVQVTAPAYSLRYADITVVPEVKPAWDKLQLSELVSHSDEEVTRAYSLANTPFDTGRFVLFIRLAVPPPNVPSAPPGIVSSYLFGIQPGEEVTLSGPYGDFGATSGEKEMIFIGGGVGMAPLRSIIFDQLERVGTKRKMSFFYGARSKIDLFYADAFEDLAARHENFSWIPALSDPLPEDEWTGETGFVHKVAFESYLKSHPAPEDCQYFLCGPPLMINAVTAMLDECGVDEDSIFADDFGG